METLRTSSNWVSGDQFFDRETEIKLLRERVADGTHTLLTAQRRMGKTSLVRELLRQSDDEGKVATVFVDLESAINAEDAVAEMTAQARPLRSVRTKLLSWLSNNAREARDNVEELGIYQLRLKLRERLNAGNWQRTGDEVFEALAANDRQVVLAIDELPVLVNRMLKGHETRPERREATDVFMGWLRKCCQTHRGRVCVIISGSVGLEPVLSQANLSAHANAYSPFDLKPWTHEIAKECLAALARGHDIGVPEDVRSEMCRRLRCCVPHHVQRFFHHLYEHLIRDNRKEATLADVEQVYQYDLLGARGQADLQHYQERLELVLGEASYITANRLLTEAASNGGLLEHSAFDRCLGEAGSTGENNTVEYVLHVLEHDGYLEAVDGGYGFVSGLLEDWWRSRYVRRPSSVSRR